MIVYRLAKQQYINDLSGRGAEITGGRWNNKGVAAVYTAGSRALAVLEVAVHVPYGIMPVNYWMIGIDVPAEDIFKLDIADLPKNWNRNPPPGSTQYLGDDFLNENKHLILQVPSAAVTGDWNYIINPRHVGFSDLRIDFTEPFEFDSRLFKI